MKILKNQKTITTVIGKLPSKLSAKDIIEIHRKLADLEKRVLILERTKQPKEKYLK